MKIYTRTGDDGETGLFAGARVHKCDPRVEAFGTIDELNASLAGALLAVKDPSIQELLERIQHQLFSVGAELATPDPDSAGTRYVTESHVLHMEESIDAFESELKPLKNFILPGGSPGSVALHLARTICRRAERHVVHLMLDPRCRVSPLVVHYLNRLSDMLFVTARVVNARSGVEDKIWVKT